MEQRWDGTRPWRRCRRHFRFIESGRELGTFPQGEGQQLVQFGVTQLSRPSCGPFQGSGHKRYSLWRVLVHLAEELGQAFCSGNTNTRHQDRGRARRGACPSGRLSANRVHGPAVGLRSGSPSLESDGRFK